MEQPPSLVRLLKLLQQVPYLASKNLYRVSAYFLHMSEEKRTQFCTTLIEATQNVIACGVCCAWQEKRGICFFCSPTRDQSVVCVVEGWQELLAIEKTSGYRGAYHVLGGVISPLDGIGPEDLSIDRLVDRVLKGAVKEIIFAFNQTPESEATAAFIARKLESVPLSISCLATGIPMGSALEYMDRLTLHKALADRRPF